MHVQRAMSSLLLSLIRKAGQLRFLYDVLSYLLALMAAPYLMCKAIISDRSYLNFLGLYRSGTRDSSGRQSIWIHASSVGEVKAALLLLEKIRENDATSRLVLTLFTPRGMKVAREEAAPDIELYYLPFDAPAIVPRAYRKFNPGLLILTETELWPNLIGNSFSRGIPVMVVNGRLSDSGFSKYFSLKPLFAPLLNQIEYIHTQSTDDAERYLKLGARREAVKSGDNIKIAGMFSSIQRFDREAVIGEYRFSGSDRIIVCGSTRPGEEEIILEAFKTIKSTHSDVKLILAPRHLDRAGEIAELVKRNGLIPMMRTAMKMSEHTEFDVLILDTLGELWKLYGIGVCAFVGGSLVPLGGHNPLEPVALGVPTCFGPYMDNCRSLADKCLTENLAARVGNEREFVDFADRCLKGEFTMPETARLEKMFSSDIDIVVGEILKRWRVTNA
ncbi:MAG: glycosyltransferase N-terminal domain-containing protein [Candidatus Zixiibacteriota bacterium]